MAVTRRAVVLRSLYKVRDLMLRRSTLFFGCEASVKVMLVRSMLKAACTMLLGFMMDEVQILGFSCVHDMYSNSSNSPSKITGGITICSHCDVVALLKLALRRRKLAGLKVEPSTPEAV